MAQSINCQKVKGTIDFYGELSSKKRYVENKAREICKKYNMEEIITPTFENTEVFSRSSGDGSDIVNKEMYTFLDKSERSITLRPEGTAGVVRSFLENKLYVNPGLKKYYYCGPMFRFERPQAGRFREFSQFGVEFFGEDNYLLDASVIALGDKILKSYGLSGKYRICVNTIGDFKSRQVFQVALKEYFSKYIDSLCDDCKRRLEKNPMRILDCKVDKESEILKNAPKIKDYLTDESKEYFKNLQEALAYLGCDYYVDDNLVRGLDYYTDTVFEYIACNDDSENSINGMAICAGGKYAELVSKFGGPDISGIGFAFGVERVTNLMDKFGLFDDNVKTKVDFVLIGLDKVAKLFTIKLANEIRDLGYVCELDYKNTSFKSQFKLVDRVNAKNILIFGEEEIKNNLVTVKNNENGEQKSVKLDDFLESIKK